MIIDTNSHIKIYNKEAVMLDFRINTFLTVCEYMNFTAASEKLNLSQPAVSQHIKYLEDCYNTKLFYRDKKNIHLTSSGEILFSAFKTVSNDEIKLKNMLNESKKQKTKIAFGVTKTIGEYMVFPSLTEYIRGNKTTNFNIHYKNTKTLLEYLDNGIIDFAIVEGCLNDKKYSINPLKSEDYIGVCSSKHKFSKKINSIIDILDERLIIREEGSGTLSILVNLLSMQNISIKDFSNLIQVDNMRMIVELVKNDCGISFLYKSAVNEQIEKGALVELPLKDFKIRHDFTFVYNKKSVFSKQMEELYNIMKNF